MAGGRSGGGGSLTRKWTMFPLAGWSWVPQANVPPSFPGATPPGNPPGNLQKPPPHDGDDDADERQPLFTAMMAPYTEKYGRHPAEFWHHTQPVC